MRETYMAVTSFQCVCHGICSVGLWPVVQSTSVLPCRCMLDIHLPDLKYKSVPIHLKAERGSPYTKTESRNFIAS